MDKQQNGVAWFGDSQVVSLNLDGGLNIIDADKGAVVDNIYVGDLPAGRV